MTESADSYETPVRPTAAPRPRRGGRPRDKKVAGRIVGIQPVGYDPRSGDEGAQAWSPEHPRSPQPQAGEDPAAATTRGGGPPGVVKPNVPPSRPPNRWTKGWVRGGFSRRHVRIGRL